MKTTHETLNDSQNAGAQEVPDVIDTSRMSDGQRAALQMAESARSSAKGSFASDLFMGRYDIQSLFPYPEQTLEDRDQGDAFLKNLESFLRDHVDPDEIDRSGEIPDDVIKGLAAMGAFGIKVPVAFHGLGLSQTNYCRAGMMLGSYCGNLTALLSAHQSIGVSQPLLLFGTEEQKRKFLPRVAQGEISAFALTEPGAGSDPATMQTRADPSPDGAHFVINGRKLWCTNGARAGVIVVMAKTPDKIVAGAPRKQITAFVLDMDSPGIEVSHRCHFMGLKALYNAVIDFKDVIVPRENILLGEGKGLRVALTTLNTGRLTLPAACAGLSKRCLEISSDWAAQRVQWGAPIARHAAIAGKIADMAANTFAMEAMTFLTSALFDRKQNDLRVETAICKLWATEKTWRIVDDTMQIRGGRGYETAASLAARGEQPIPVERLFRDSRINLIFEGSSEIMRLFIAREALDPHLKVGGPVVNSQLPLAARARAALASAAFYSAWYPRQWLPSPASLPRGIHPILARHLRLNAAAAKRLGRSLFHAMARYGPKLERRQLLLGRFVDIGAELFAMTAACLRAQAMQSAESAVAADAIQLADYFCASAAQRVESLFSSLRRNADDQGYKVTASILQGRHKWLQQGAVRL